MSEEQRVLSDIVWTPERGMETPEVRSIAWNNFLLSDEMFMGQWRTAAEIRITPETALASTVVLACCRILAETISSLPLHVMRRSSDGGASPASDIPLYKVLAFAPNEWQTKFEFFEQMVMNLTLWGNSYSLIRSGRYGAVSALDNLHPSRMDVERLENGRLRYSYTNPETGRLERYTQDQVMHIRWTAEPDGIKGMVPIEIAREAIALARACEIHASKYWANSARPGVVLQTDNSLSPEAAERLRDNWERLHRGSDRSHRTAILTNGLKVEQIGFNAEQSQFLDSRRFQSEEIARVYRLPVSLVQGQSSGNMEATGQEFVTYTLVPWLRRIESGISRSLIYNDDVFFAEFDTKALMRANSNARAAFYSTMQNLGIYSINDSRRDEGLPPIEHGDKHFVAMNMIPLEQAVKGPQQQDPMAAMMGGAPGGPPPEMPGAKPSLPGVKDGHAPPEAPKGEASEKKPEPPFAEGDVVTWGDGKIGELKHIMDKGTLDLKSGEKVEVKPGEPVALVVDPKSGEEFAVKVAELQKAKPAEAVEQRRLSPQSKALYDAQEAIVREKGRWSQADAHYQERNPFASRGIHCRNCVYYEEGGSCEIVKGSIRPDAICKLWIIPEERLSIPEQREGEPERRDDNCGREKGGVFGPKNKCQKDAGEGGQDEPAKSDTSKPEESSVSARVFPERSAKFRSAIDDVVAKSGGDPAKVWDRSKGLAETPPPAEVGRFADEQQGQTGKPLTPEAEASYKALVDEIGRQYEALLASGLKVHAWKGEGEPYGDPPGSSRPNSDKMRRDIADSGEYSFFMTESGFGAGNVTENHPMLRPTKFKTSDGEPMIANDLFRVVHDMVAHVRGGYSFSTNGEYNGMLTHASTLPEGAWPALFAETFGQNAVYEKTGNYAAQNAYASKIGPEIIKAELAKRNRKARRAVDAEDEGDEPLGYQHLKVRPWLMRPTSESRAFCPTGEGGGVKNDCSSEDGSTTSPSGASSKSRPSPMPRGKVGDPKSDVSLLSPTGDFYPVDRQASKNGWATHDEWAKVHGVKGGLDELMDKGWMRVVRIGNSVYASSDTGKSLTPKQEKSLKDHAVIMGHDGVVYENENGVEHNVWSKEDRAFCPTGEGGGVKTGDGGGIDNSCGSDDGSPGAGSSSRSPDSLPKSFPRGSDKFRDAINSVSPDPKAIWDRAKGRADTPPEKILTSAADEQTSSGSSLTPEAEKSYADLVDEIGRQYEALVAAGLKVRAWRGEGEPYGDPPGSTKPNSDKMRAEVAKTGEFSFFMTERGFGTGSATPDHPMLRETQYKTADGEPMIANDLFRVVHDMVAHVRGGYSFSTNGEFNGTLSHASTLPEAAWPALFAETFGQNAVYERTGGYANQNAYASDAGAEMIRRELSKRRGESRAESDDADSDEPLGWQHIKSRPHLAKSLAESRAYCPTGKGGGIKNDCSPNEGEGGGEKEFKTQETTRAALKSIRETGGFSVDPFTAESPTTGYMVSVVPAAETILDTPEAVTDEVMEKFLKDNEAAFRERPTLHVGGWLDKATGKVYLDLSEQFDDLDDAIDSAESTNQLAIWDLNVGNEIRKEDYSGRRTRGRKEPGSRSLRSPKRPRRQSDRRSDSRTRPSHSRRGEGEERAAAQKRLIATASRAMGSNMPRVEVRDIGEAIAVYDHRDDVLLVSPTLPEELQTGYASQANPYIHEAAHRIHARANPQSYETAASVEFSAEQRQLIGEEVSSIAAIDGREFVAEVLAGILAGKKYGHDILSLAREVAGSEVIP